MSTVELPGGGPCAPPSGHAAGAPLNAIPAGNIIPTCGFDGKAGGKGPLVGAPPAGPCGTPSTGIPAGAFSAGASVSAPSSPPSPAL